MAKYQMPQNCEIRFVQLNGKTLLAHACCSITGLSSHARHFRLGRNYSHTLPDSILQSMIGTIYGTTIVQYNFLYFTTTFALDYNHTLQRHKTRKKNLILGFFTTFLLSYDSMS